MTAGENATQHRGINSSNRDAQSSAAEKLHPQTDCGPLTARSLTHKGHTLHFDCLVVPTHSEPAWSYRHAMQTVHPRSTRCTHIPHRAAPRELAPPLHAGPPKKTSHRTPDGASVTCVGAHLPGRAPGRQKATFIGHAQSRLPGTSTHNLPRNQSCDRSSCRHG